MAQTRAEKLAKARSYKEANREAILAWHKSYNAQRMADPVRRAKKRKQDRASAKKNYANGRAYDKARDPVKQRARGLVRNRIWRGTLKRLPCEICGDPKSHAHHEDYAKPLDVKWLCPTHHLEAHRVE